MLASAPILDLLSNANAVDEEIYDIRFEEVVSLVDQEQFEEASNLIQAIFTEGRIDIRLVMYYLYAQFITQGMVALEEIFSTLMNILTDHWKNISPINQRDKYLEQSIIWFFSSIAKQLKRSEKLVKEKKPDIFLKQSVDALTPEVITQLSNSCHAMQAFLSQKFNDKSLIQYMLFIEKWLAAVKTPDQTEKPTPPLPLQTETKDHTPQTSASPQEALTLSEPMQLLMRKLEAFEALIREEKFEKAALIADDLSLILKNFDPALFFPKLFTPYFALIARHIDDLSQEWENKGSLKWESLHKLYQTDLSEFILW